ncbi:MAG TPA: hypothetical protein VJH68_02595 [Candidatus Nanoarchaeia archaeon]|nr:hypothetical protein [Candidatus Nanoarchaeia archaeon]
MDRTSPEYISALIKKKPHLGDPKEIEITRKIREKVLREEWVREAFSEIKTIQRDYLKEMIENVFNPGFIHQRTQEVLTQVSGLLHSEIVESTGNLAKLPAGQAVLLATNHFGAYKLLGLSPKEDLGIDIAGYDWIYPYPMYFAALKPVADKIGTNLYYVSDDFPQIFGDIHRQAGFINVPPKKIIKVGRTAILQDQTEALIRSHPKATIVNYPEGGTSGKYNGLGPYDLEPFSTGSYVIAANLGLPILPVAQYFDRCKGFQLKVFEPFVPPITDREGYRWYADANQAQMQAWLDQRKDA